MAPTLDSSILEAALEGLSLQHERLTQQIAMIRAHLGSPVARDGAAAPVRRRLSSAGRKAIAKAARERWARQRAAKAAAQTKTATKEAGKTAKAVAKKAPKKKPAKRSAVKTATKLKAQPTTAAAPQADVQENAPQEA